VWLSSPTESVLKTEVGLMGGGKLAFVHGSENCLKEYKKEEILHNRSTYFTLITLEYTETSPRKASSKRTFQTL